MKHLNNFFALGAAVALALVAAVLQGIPEARFASALLVVGLVVLFISGVFAVGFLKIKSLQHVWQESTTINDREYLVLQMNRHHTILIDSAQLNAPITMVSPANAAPPSIVHGIEQSVAQVEMETLVASLPAVEHFSDEDFERTYLR